RYDDIARFFCSNGLVVCGNDHLGHGDSVKSEKDYGYFAKKDGDRIIVRDCAELHNIIREKYRHLPYIVFGHSMGSFVARRLIVEYGEDIDGLILSGTAGSGQPFGMGIAVSDTVGLFRGKRHRSKLITGIAFGKYNERFEGDTGVEWVSNDRERLLKYANDPKCNFMFTCAGYRDLFKLLKYVNSDQWYEDFPKHVPVYLLCGEDDPVGNYGKGVSEVAEKLNDASVSSVTLKIYPGERHEVHNGLAKQEMYRDTLNWIDGVIEGIHDERKQGNEFASADDV
ncbi:MAG: alpha/beta fold hydrolase, partial [Clostridia bacterium]|nr:alpha/beta fold hydrolase [Clostridia bacterium]